MLREIFELLLARYSKRFERSPCGRTADLLLRNILYSGVRVIQLQQCKAFPPGCRSIHLIFPRDDTVIQSIVAALRPRMRRRAMDP